MWVAATVNGAMALAAQGVAEATAATDDAERRFRARSDPSPRALTPSFCAPNWDPAATGVDVAGQPFGGPSEGCAA